MITVSHITLSRGTKLLLDDASVQLNQGYKAGLIGRNGTGKSSLIQVILGNVSPQSGEIKLSPNCRIGYLAQELPTSDTDILQYTCQGDQQWWEIQQQITQAEADADGEVLAELYATLEQIDGYRIEQRAARILNGLGFDESQLQQKISDFSGGWQMRLQLARVLMTRADLLLLDEPTNHLDLESIIWLESWLQTAPATAIIISHDRDFLDAVCTHSIHLTQQQLRLYQGNYSSFAKQLNEALILQAKSNEKILQKRAHMQSFVDRFRAKASKAAQAQSRLKALEKLETSSSLQAESGFRLRFLDCEKVAYPALSISGKMGYPQHTVIPFAELSVGYGERIGIVGRNGSGKTTLLKSLSSQIPLLDGEVGSNPKVNIGYFSQQQLDNLHMDQSPYQHLKAIAPKQSEAELRKYLGQFAFTDQRISEPIHHFSGGEKSRLALALLIWKKPNVLILDEPTNHLDMTMREALIIALQQYEGTVLLVSHDRYLLKACVDALVMVHDGKLQRFDGDCDDYSHFVLNKLDQHAEDHSTQTNSTKKKSHKNHKKIKKIEKKIAQLQTKLASLDASMADPDLLKPEQQQQLQNLSQQREDLAEQLQKAEEDWLDLSSA